MSESDLQDELKKISDTLYEEPREDTFGELIGEFYSRRMLSTAIMVWAMFLVHFALAIVCGVSIFYAESTQLQILLGALLVCFMQIAMSSKIFAWQVVHKNHIRREIKRLEMRVAELAHANSSTN